MRLNLAGKLIRSITLMSLMGILSVVLAGAQDAQEASKEKKDFIKTGVIASSGRMGRGAVQSEALNGVPGDEVNVISAGVSRKQQGYCDVTVSNNSEKTSYSVSFAVIGRENDGSKQLNQSFSAVLAPGKSTVKTVSCRDYQMAVDLRSAKALNKDD